VKSSSFPNGTSAPTAATHSFPPRVANPPRETRARPLRPLPRPNPPLPGARVAARRLILASASPRRQEALKALGMDHQIVISHAEDSLPPPPDPTDPLPAAHAKAADVLTQHPDALVLAGDTIVVVGGVALGKPGTPENAVSMLRTLRGRRHAVHTAIAVVTEDGTRDSRVIAPLVMRDYSDDEVNCYVATGEPLDCAGAYDIHRLGGQLIASVAGCFSAIVGLPIAQTVGLLEQSGVTIPLDAAEVCSALYRRPCLASSMLTRPRCLPERRGVGA